MRSIRGLVACIILLVTVPVAIAVAIATGGGGAESIIHFGIGAGAVLLATAAFDFGLPRPIAWLGAISAGLFGSIFLLQGVAENVGNAALYDFAFFVVGQGPERILPDIFVIWLVALLLLVSEGRTRILGWVVMTVFIVWEVATVGAPLLGIEMQDIKLRWLLPYVWLVFESAKPAVVHRFGPSSRDPQLAGPTGAA